MIIQIILCTQMLSIYCFNITKMCGYMYGHYQQIHPVCLAMLSSTVCYTGNPNLLFEVVRHFILPTSRNITARFIDYIYLTQVCFSAK